MVHVDSVTSISPTTSTDLSTDTTTQLIGEAHMHTTARREHMVHTYGIGMVCHHTTGVSVSV